MRWSAASTFLQSRVGRRLFAAFFVLVAVLVGAVSLLAYQLTDYIVRQSASQLSSEMTKAVGINLIDRLRAAESLLRIHAQSLAAGTPPTALSERMAVVFSNVRVEASASVLPAGTGALASLRVQDGDVPDTPPAVELVVPMEPWRVHGTLNAEYLWENAQSGTHRICFSGAGFARPYCQGVQETGAAVIRSEREIFFRPYLDTPSWTVTAMLAPSVERHLPIGTAALVGNVAGIAFLLALAASSALLRKLTQPLDALMSGTRAMQRGDFSRRVRIAGPRSEFTDLADSFNAMTEEVGHDLQLFQLLAQMDRAIVDQHPFEEVVRLTLAHLDMAACGGAACVVQWPDGEPSPWALALLPDGTLERRPATAPGGGGHAGGPHTEALAGQPWVDLPVAQTQTQRVWLRVARVPVAPERAVRELGAFRQRLAVALHAEQREQQLRERATRDSLTGLLNRYGLVETIDQLATQYGAQAQDSTAGFAVVYMDLDGFKEINDAYGHDVGDSVLKEVAARLLHCMGASALAIGRPAGDEFVFVLPADASRSYRGTIDAVMQAVRQPVVVPPRKLHLTASFGMSLFPEHGSTHADLLKYADLAMYSAKSSGRHMLVEFDHALNAELDERMLLRRDLRHALADGQMFVVFQPRVAGTHGQIASVEALLRWRHPDKGFVSPEIFIALAEESEFILELGRWVLRQALGQFQQWRSIPNHPVRHLSVSLSPLQLADPALPAQLQALLEEFHIQPGELELEITEGALIRDVDTAVERLAALRALGVAIALDDFGVGYSAMSYLSQLPFDTLKIDKSFVFAFGVERPALAIATAIVALAKALDKRVVAEGVETPEQAALLQGLGVDELQGYLFGKPQSAAELEALLAVTPQPSRTAP
ncbi:MAG TPA: EAL domain-containing protein [Giesbergeria sp.]|nr:EAL domain-containing protein [Giesbergeria sp.]